MYFRNNNFNKATFRTLCDLTDQSTNYTNLNTWIEKQYPNDFDKRSVYELIDDILIDGQLNEDHWFTYFGFGTNEKKFVGFSEDGTTCINVEANVTEVGLNLLENFIFYSLFAEA